MNLFTSLFFITLGLFGVYTIEFGEASGSLGSRPLRSPQARARGAM